jgi:proline iminopeptidase
VTHRSDASFEAREGYVPVSGAQLYFRDVGNGRPIVVLHGGPDFNHNYLLPELDRLSSTYRLIYYDQRGRGKSSAGVAAEDVSVDSELEDLDQLRQQLGFDSIVLLGHSWGCLLALEYATRHPKRVSHLILLNSAPASYVDRRQFREQREARDAAVLATMRAIASASEYARGDISTEAEYYRAHFSKALFRPDHAEIVVRRLRAHFLPEDILKARAIEDRLYSETTLSPGYDPTPRLRKLMIPTLVIHGDHDLIPLQCATNVAEAVPGARLVVLRDCGHFAFLERPAEVCAAITGFVA